jgi:iron complex outermembrane receptor protein
MCFQARVDSNLHANMDATLAKTAKQFDEVIGGCRDLFTKKTHDYGTAWRILRTPSLTDQIFIKAQRIRTLELGARGRLGAHTTYELALFQADAGDAIVQFLETNGRAFFRNAGRTRSRGVEAGIVTQPMTWLELRAAWTLADYRFTDYVISLTSTTADTLNGNRLAGVPRQALRLGARMSWGAASLDIDHTSQGEMFGDDRNLVPVDGWGAGQLNLRAAWTGQVAGWRAEPFVSVQNALNTAYVGAVTLNGFGGRVLEPAPLRNWYIGVELQAPLIR